MREIKFRAWDKENKRLYESFELFNFVFLLQSEIQKGRSPLDFEIMQFTGLYDKNGKEIYEGDIVSWGVGRCVVEFPRSYDFLSGIFAPVEVIGNIYENPELVN